MVVSNIPGVALTTSSLFLLVVAIALNSPHLFYMSTAMIATIGAARIQAWYSVRNLTIRRNAPSEAQIGEWVQVELTVTSAQKIKRPLISIWDHLPQRLVNNTLTPSTPIAPAPDTSVVSRYRFQPQKRGRYRWSKISVVGTDALGLISTVKEYSADMADLLVLPAPIPVPFNVNSAAGWGNSESEYGLSRGTGIEPRGIREYVSGDSMRYVHWRSTAKTGKLVVKEFETGSNAAVAIYVQNTRGTDVGTGSHTTLELMCSHLAYMCGRMVRQGVRVQFPTFETGLGAVSPHEREQEVLRILAELNGNSASALATEIISSRRGLMTGSSVFILVSVLDPGLPAAIQAIRREGHAVTCMIYDASAFSKGRRGFDASKSAAQTKFMDLLRGSGAIIREMPIEGAFVA